MPCSRPASRTPHDPRLKHNFLDKCPKLKGSIPYLYYSLYVILDLFSRYVVGWMVARHENAHLAERLIAATCGKQGISPDQLTIHADRGAPMRSKLVALLLSDLGIDASHSRPRVSNVSVRRRPS